MKRVFIIGCPRSGSTWSTFLLAQHPRVATLQHAKVFDYLVRMRDWHRNKAGYAFLVDPLSGGEETVRLADVFPEEELYPLLSSVGAGILDRVASLRPDVSVVVDKTPENGHLAELILKLFPDAYFLHVVRDARSVFCSHRSASRSWARWEFPTQPVDGARFWRRDVEASLAVEGMTERYLQVRYEDLKDDGVGEFERILAWIGLDAEPGFAEHAIQASSKDKVSETEHLPENFVRKTPSGGWREELSRGEVRVIEYLAGDLLERLGYELVSQPSSKPLRVRWRDLTEPTLAFLEQKLHRLMQLGRWRWVGRKLEWRDP